MVSEYIEKAWKAYSKNWVSFIVAYILLFAIFVAIFGIGLLSLLMSGILTIGFGLASLGLIGIGAVFLLIAMISAIVLSIGITGMAAESLKGKTKIKTMFEIAKKRWQTAIGVSVIIGIIAVLLLSIVFVISFLIPLFGFILGLIPYFLIIILFTLTTPAVAVEKFGTMKCIEKAVKVAKSNYLNLLVLIVVYTAINVLISWVPYVGSLITMFIVAPMMQISLVYFYLKNK